MTSQNRLNAGAEYVLYRIWATLQTERGIHVESLLTCVGGLAGYACRNYARQAQTSGDAPMELLVESPLSIWSLVSRAVLKLGQPLPDIHEIVRRASQSSGAEALDVPHLPGWHQPQHPALVYLKQLWPQTLPIAQRFCLRPMQMPVLYGIALQRAIEHTKDLLSPTLAASISMECAIAMSRVDLPEPAPGLLPTAASTSAPELARIPANAPRATPARRSKAADQNDSGTSRILAMSQVSAMVKRVPPSAHVATLACLAFVATAGAMYRADRGERNFESTSTVLAMTTGASQPTRADSPIDVGSDQGADRGSDPNSDSLIDEQQALLAEARADLPTELSAQTALNASASPTPPAAFLEQPDDQDTPRPQPSDYGSDEGLMRDDSGQTIRMAAEE